MILDTLADVFGGNEIDRVQVNGFPENLPRRADLLERRQQGHDLDDPAAAGHPSKSSLADGSGFSGSTAWESGVRSRLYLSRPENAGPGRAHPQPGRKRITRAAMMGSWRSSGARAYFVGMSALGDVSRMAKVIQNEDWISPGIWERLTWKNGAMRATCMGRW